MRVQSRKTTIPSQEQINYRLNRTGNLVEEEHLTHLFESVDCQLQMRAAQTPEREIPSLSTSELLHYIEVGEAKLKDGPLSYREDDLIEARLDIAREELKKRENDSGKKVQ